MILYAVILSWIPYGGEDRDLVIGHIAEDLPPEDLNYLKSNESENVQDFILSILPYAFLIHLSSILSSSWLGCFQYLYLIFPVYGFTVTWFQYLLIDSHLYDLSGPTFLLETDTFLKIMRH
jgi:hypothetical protein